MTNKETVISHFPEARAVKRADGWYIYNPGAHGPEIMSDIHASPNKAWEDASMDLEDWIKPAPAPETKIRPMISRAEKMNRRKRNRIARKARKINRRAS